MSVPTNKVRIVLQKLMEGFLQGAEGIAFVNTQHAIESFSRFLDDSLLDDGWKGMIK